jgi:glycosyltransferase involved in cell wall biosynthesis
MKIGIYAFWSLGWDGQTLSGPGCHIRYVRHFLEMAEGVRLFTNLVQVHRQIIPETLRNGRFEVVPIPWGEFVSTWLHLGELRRLLAANLEGLEAMYVRLYDPCAWLLAALCEQRGINLLFHIVGDPLAGIFQRDDWSLAGKWLRRAMFWPEERLVKRVVRRHPLIVEGGELARLIRQRGLSAEEVMSTTLENSDFFSREDTCQGPVAVILLVSFLRPPKLVEILLEALALLLREGCRLHLRLVGPIEPSSYEDFLRERVQSLGIAAHVDFVGYVPLGGPLNAELRAADIFAFPSSTEGNPRVLLEAAANSLPIVSTKVGSVPQMFTDGESALVVPIGDALAMARALARFLDDPALRRRCIRAAQDTAREHMIDAFIQMLVRRLEESREIGRRVKGGESS